MGLMENNNSMSGSKPLNIVLSTLIAVFLLGIIVMAFVLASDKTADVLDPTTVTGNSLDEVLTLVNGTGNVTSVNSLSGILLSNVVLYNNTGGEIISSGNYTFTGGTIVGSDSSSYLDSLVNVTADYSYTTDSLGQSILGNLSGDMGDATDFNPLFIIFAAIVALILFVVLIVMGIRKTGLGGMGSA